MERMTCLNASIQVKDFSARGEIAINESRLSFDIREGIVSVRFIERTCRDLDIVNALSNKWILFKDYQNEESESRRSDPQKQIFALLRFGFYNGDALCFFAQSIIVEFYKTDIFVLDIFSPCLVNHFEKVDEFDFNSCGYVDDNPCAILSKDNGSLKIFRTVAVEYNRHAVSYQFTFPKNFVGGFRFEYDKPFTNELIKECVDAVNNYCRFLLRDNGFFVSHVEVGGSEFDLRSYLYYPPQTKKIETEILFSYDDIKENFGNLMSLFFENGTDFAPLYPLETKTYQTLDILRIASMFENQYRKNVEAQMSDYVNHERLYRDAYLKVVVLQEGNNDLEKAIYFGEKFKQHQAVMTTLKMQLQFVFEKLLNVLGTDAEKIKNSVGLKILDYDICKLANTIRDARNDIAHCLEKGIDYGTALKHTFTLQLMVYYMIFERVGLEKDVIKKIILGTSRYSKWIFDIK